MEVNIEITSSGPAFLLRQDGAEIASWGTLEVSDWHEDLSDTVVILATKYDSEYTATVELTINETKRLIDELARVLVDRGNAEPSRHVPSVDQGVCPEGHPCRVFVSGGGETSRMCNGDDDYRGRPLLDTEYRIALTDRELEDGV